MSTSASDLWAHICQAHPSESFRAEDIACECRLVLRVARNQLRALVAQGKLTRQGRRYQLPEVHVPPAVTATQTTQHLSDPAERLFPLRDPETAVADPQVQEAILRALREHGRPMSESMLRSRLVCPTKLLRPGVFEASCKDLTASGALTREPAPTRRYALESA